MKKDKTPWIIKVDEIVDEAPKKPRKPKLRENVVYKLRDPKTGLFLVECVRPRFSEEGAMLLSRVSAMRIWLRYNFQRALAFPWHRPAGSYDTPDLELVSFELTLTEKSSTIESEDVTSIAKLSDKFPTYSNMARFIESCIRSQKYKKMSHIIEVNEVPDDGVIPSDFEKQLVTVDYNDAIFGTYTEADAIYLKMLLSDYDPDVYDLEK